MNEALRLAEELEWQTHWKDHAAELRRLVAEHEEDQRVIAVWRGRTQRAEAQRDALLEALKEVVAFTGAHGGPYAQARAAIKAAEGENT